MQVHIVNLTPDDMQIIQQVASLLVEAFKEHWPEAWPNTEEALETVMESFGDDHISRVALTGDGTVVGWIGGISEYSGNVWELDPLVVKPSHQQTGIGRSLVADLEAQVRARGGITIMLGTDDVDNQTTLSGVNLYPNVCQHISSIRNLGRHPYEFYQKLGYVVTGVVPDANGFGKPDILMAKCVASVS